MDLNDAEHTFNVLEDYGNVPEDAPDEPYRVFFGRVVDWGKRELVNEFSIKDRQFIGNTTMDPLLAFLMANQAKVSVFNSSLKPYLLYCRTYGWVATLAWESAGNFKSDHNSEIRYFHNSKFSHSNSQCYVN